MKTHPNVPLFYPRLPLDKKTNFKAHFLPADKSNKLIVPHCLCGHVDSSFSPFKENRHSIEAYIETIGTTAVDWKTTKQLICATSASDSETRAFYSATKRIKRHRIFLQQIGIAIPSASPIFNNFKSAVAQPTTIFEDNKGTVDMIRAERVTSNLKHIDIPLSYIHQQNQNGSITCEQCPSHHMWADTLTKQETGPKHLAARDKYMGKRYYPPPGSEHYKMLTKKVPLS